MVTERFHRPVTPFENRLISSVGVAATKLLNADADRLGFLFVNLSVNDIYIAPFPDVSATKGIKCGPNGGSVTATWDEDFEMLGKEWYCLAAAAASSLLIVEYIATS